MSKLLKSKFLLGVLVVTVLVVGGVVAVKADTAAAESCSITTTLRAGSTGVEVQCLQTVVGAVADGNFGPMTKAVVMALWGGGGVGGRGGVGSLFPVQMRG